MGKPLIEYPIGGDMQIHKQLLNVENEANYKCEKCGKTFGRKDNLKKHVNNIH